MATFVWIVILALAGLLVLVTLGFLGRGVASSLAATERVADRLASSAAADLDRLLRVSLRQGRRIVILLAGSTVLLIGVAMIVLPGPAFIVIPAGLGILAIEFVWARRWLLRLQRTMQRIKEHVRNRGRRPRPVVPEGSEPLP